MLSNRDLSRRDATLCGSTTPKSAGDGHGGRRDDAGAQHRVVRRDGASRVMHGIVDVDDTGQALAGRESSKRLEDLLDGRMHEASGDVDAVPHVVVVRGCALSFS